jgi:glycosyltransferase involved in cell wall biosynthesis
MIRFSIVVPTFNASGFIHETIESLLKQTYLDFEAVLVDDGSLDTTREIVKSYVKSNQGKLMFIEQNHEGSIYARNRGIQRATGQYVVSLDHDDILLPHALSVYEQTINFFHEPPLLLARMQYFRKPEEIDFACWNKKEIICAEFKDFFSKNISIGISNSCIVAKTASVVRANGYKEDSFCFDDRTFLFGLGVETPFVAIQYPKTCGYRLRSGSASKDLDFIRSAALSMIKRERRGYFPGGAKRKIDRRGLIATNLLSNMNRRVLKAEGVSGLKKASFIISIFWNFKAIAFYALYRKIRSRFYSRKIHTIKAQ